MLDDIIMIPIGSGKPESLDNLPKNLTGILGNSHVFDNYEFKPDDASDWKPVVHNVDGNTDNSTIQQDSCDVSLNTKFDTYNIISWYEAARSKANSRGWTSFSVAATAGELGICTSSVVPGDTVSAVTPHTSLTVENIDFDPEDDDIPVTDPPVDPDDWDDDDWTDKNPNNIWDGNKPIPGPCPVTNLEDAFMSPDGSIRIGNIRLFRNKKTGKYEPVDFNDPYTRAKYLSAKKIDKKRTKYVLKDDFKDVYEIEDCINTKITLEVAKNILGLEDKAGDVYWENVNGVWKFVIKNDPPITGDLKKDGDVYWDNTNKKLIIKEDDRLGGLEDKAGDVYWEQVNGVWKFVIKNDTPITGDLDKSGDVYWDNTNKKLIIKEDDSQWPPPALTDREGGLVLWSPNEKTGGEFVASADMESKLNAAWGRLSSLQSDGYVYWDNDNKEFKTNSTSFDKLGALYAAFDRILSGVEGGKSFTDVHWNGSSFELREPHGIDFGDEAGYLYWSKGKLQLKPAPPIYEAGAGISIDSNGKISVKVDDSTIKIDDSGLYSTVKADITLKAGTGISITENSDGSYTIKNTAPWSTDKITVSGGLITKTYNSTTNTVKLTTPTTTECE